MVQFTVILIRWSKYKQHGVTNRSEVNITSCKLVHICWIPVSNTWVGHLRLLKTFMNTYIRHVFRTYVSDMCIFSPDKRLFSVDTRVKMCSQNTFTWHTIVFSGHMCPTHVSDSCVPMCNDFTCSSAKQHMGAQIKVEDIMARTALPSAAKNMIMLHTANTISC